MQKPVPVFFDLPMRMIGQFEDGEAAGTFSNYLYASGIKNQVDASGTGSWEIWVHDEEELERARLMLERFRTNPCNPEFKETGRAAEVIRRREIDEDLSYAKKIKRRKDLVLPFSVYGLGPITVALIGVSVAVFLFSKLGAHLEPVFPLFISEVDVKGGFFARLHGLPEIRHGEIWRIFTPIFVHFHLLHIVFNMLWLRDLGSMIEARSPGTKFLLLVFLTAAGSNLLQYFVSGPSFGGMSGVVYGLLGYVWIRSRFDPGSGLFLHRSTVTMMLIWLVLCYTGLLGPIANTAHTAGLLLGMIAGYLSSLRKH